MTDLTRRQALTLGAAAGVAAMFGRTATTRGATAAGDGHLSRASYMPLVGESFAVAGASLALVAVRDLDHLAGRDDAFRLDLTGPPGLVDGGIQRFEHSALGAFDLFVAPVDAPTNDVRHYEVVIDRSVPLAPDPAAARKPEPPAAGTTQPAPEQTPAAPAAAPTAPTAASPRPRKRRSTVRHLVAKARSKSKARAKRAAAVARRARRRRWLSGRRR